MAKIEMSVITRGRIPRGVEREIANTLHDCYRRFGSKSPYKVGVFVAENAAMIRDFLREEKFRLGINITDDEESVCYYDVWQGYPRISVCLERLTEFSKLARQGALRHEAAHSVLHGSLEYRIFRIPENCRQIALIKGIDSTVLEQVIYKLSGAVKDCEASIFLVDHDFIDCQAAFGLEWVWFPKEDKAISAAAATDRQAKFIYQTALLRPILFAHPLLSLPKAKKISLERQVLLGRRVEELVERLSGSEQGRLLQVANLIAEGLTQDTHQNVDSALHQAMSLA
ncbi:MAG: hypothetical protein SU899_06165 [Chloroflexota bacterium]|nr:hypothetical protein [Chloroflexota bacterium]